MFCVCVCVCVQDSWALGRALWGMLSPDEHATPFPGGGDAHSFLDEAYAPPADAVVPAAGGGGGGGDRTFRVAAGRIVRDLLHVDPAARCTLAAAVSRLEALLFLLLPPAPPAGARAEVLPRLPGALEALQVAALAVDAAAAAAAPTVVEMLLVDYAGSPRCAPGAVADVLRDLLE